MEASLCAWSRQGRAWLLSHSLQVGTSDIVVGAPVRLMISHECRTDAPDPLLDAVLLHCLNHCAKVADRVKRGNDRLKAGEGAAGEAPRDQGFTRPKVRAMKRIMPASQHCRALLQRSGHVAPPHFSLVQTCSSQSSEHPHIDWALDAFGLHHPCEVLRRSGSVQTDHDEHLNRLPCSS